MGDGLISREFPPSRFPPCLPCSRLQASASPRCPHRVVGLRVTHQDGPHFRRDTGPGEGSGSWSAGAQGGQSTAGPGPWRSGIYSAGGRATVVNIGGLHSPLRSLPLFSKEGSSPSRMFSRALVMQNEEGKRENRHKS